MNIREPAEPFIVMPNIHASFNRINVLLVVAIAAAGGVALWLEGYLPRVDWAFALYMASMFVFAGWVAAFAISTRRFLRLVALAGVGGYATQYVGAVLGGIWSYPPPNRTFYFVPAAFMIASLVTYGLIIKILAPAWRRRLPELSRWLNLLVVVAIMCIVVLASQPYRDGQGAVFWIYYGAMFIVALYCVLVMDMATLLALVVSAVIVGFCSESLGARCGLWTFDNDPRWLPPTWLFLGSWPLEIMMHFSLSAPGLGRRRYRTARADAHRGHSMRTVMTAAVVHKGRL